MPTSKIKKDAREGKGTVKSLEKKWDTAKDAAKKSAKNPKNPWPLAMHIYENETKGTALNAAQRLKAADDLVDEANDAASAADADAAQSGE